MTITARRAITLILVFLLSALAALAVRYGAHYAVHLLATHYHGSPGHGTLADADTHYHG